MIFPCDIYIRVQKNPPGFRIPLAKFSLDSWFSQVRNPDKALKGGKGDDFRFA